FSYFSKEAIYKLEELLEKEVIQDLVNRFEAGREEIEKVLNSKDLEKDFPLLSISFFFKIAQPLFKISLILKERSEYIEDLKKLALIMAKVLRESSHTRKEDLIYSMSILIDRDIWVIEKMSKYGLEELIKKLIERAKEISIGFINTTINLTFAWLSAISAILNIVKKYNEENLNKIIDLSLELSKELDSYLDTLDLLLDDETYEELREIKLI
ncbi:MAG: hypothetical protein ACO2OO_03535, partial [Candidatus Aenigmatarchaeota archaeon]